MTVNSKPVVNLKSVFSDKSFLKNLFIIAYNIAKFYKLLCKYFRHNNDRPFRHY